MAEAPVLPTRIRLLALLQIPLILIAIAIYAYIGWSLRPLLQQEAQLRRDIAERNRALRDLISQVDQKTAILNELDARIKREGGPNLQQAVKSIVPLSAQITVKTSASETKLFTKEGGKIYDFYLWIEGPAQVLDQVAAVEYRFNHPSFREPIKKSEDRSTGFRVHYLGWGCLASVRVNVFSKSSDISAGGINFSMCAALGWN